MALESIYLGETPHEESCQQYGTDHYDAVMAKAECRALINQLIRILGPVPVGVDFRIVTENHSDGKCYSVYVYYAENVEHAVAYAFAAESNYPETWDAAARQELHWAVIQR